jgi:hypothetical protein
VGNTEVTDSSFGSVAGHQNLTYSLPEVGFARFLIADWPDRRMRDVFAERLNRQHISATEKPRERTYSDSRTREEFPYAATT